MEHTLRSGRHASHPIKVQAGHSSRMEKNGHDGERLKGWN